MVGENGGDVQIKGCNLRHYFQPYVRVPVHQQSASEGVVLKGNTGRIHNFHIHGEWKFQVLNDSGFNFYFKNIGAKGQVVGHQKNSDIQIPKTGRFQKRTMGIGKKNAEMIMKSLDENVKVVEE